MDSIQLSSYKDAKQKGIAKPPERKTDFAIGGDPEVMYDALEKMVGI